jgi:membrane-associated protease RseP (regulator of RpoE activity)
VLRLGDQEAMSGPKHLWSGDWESESQRPAATRPPAPEPEAQPAEPDRARRFSRRQLAIALTTGVAAAAVTVGLVVALGGGSQKPKQPAKHAGAASTLGQSHGSGGQGLTTPAQPCQQTATGCSQTTAVVPTVSGPFANWMGMEIVTSPSGVVVDTVRGGSPADLAGFEPGDQILSVDTHVIGTVSELRTDTDSVKVGAPVTIAVLRSSVQLTLTSVHMTQRPTIHP